MKYAKYSKYDYKKTNFNTHFIRFVKSLNFIKIWKQLLAGYVRQGTCI